ncbi:hypothetical protein QBC36DRAFT_333139 [Triangularia setosa]|uniref:Uncharacterized protein n=1 Tax=Triangularia setosa TaxID=2587417 RepID=A0AAN6W5F9_9PEZI|nr:hypothetical protein QBC36DRAFT_333139 [Podospora setosa]
MDLVTPIGLVSAILSFVTFWFQACQGRGRNTLRGQLGRKCHAAICYHQNGLIPFKAISPGTLDSTIFRLSVGRGIRAV